MASLRVESLSVSLGETGRRLLDQVSFALPAGQRRALIGRSGSGKSLLASSLTGLLRPPLTVCGGKILLDGADLLGASGAGFREHRGLSVFHLLQNSGSALSPCLRIRRQVRRAAEIRDPRTAGERAVEALGTVGLAAHAERYPFELSGGMRQRVLLAMALAMEPSVLIADEVTTGLDPVTQSEILDCLDHALRASGASLLLVTHDLRAAARLCPRAILLDRGRVVAESDWSHIEENGPEVTSLIDASRRLER